LKADMSATIRAEDGSSFHAETAWIVVEGSTADRGIAVEIPLP